MNAHTATAAAWTCFNVSIEDGVAHIQLKRPEAMNTMNKAFWAELPAIVRDIDDNARARCIVISSTGKHFSAGMDLSVFANVGEGRGEADRHVAGESFRRHVHALQDTFSCLDEARVPVIAAIQGGCIGGAVDFTSACDIRYCSADAFFCIMEINIGMTADVGTFPRLCKLIPEGWVRELAYTGRRLPAQRARDIGLVNEVFDTHEAVVAHALATAKEIASKSPLAVAGSKVMINYARDHTIKDGLDYIAVWQTGMFSGPHMAETFVAKQEGRDPVFPDLLPLRKGL
ncbi:MAG: crotonase/enoyl-CoA hydratase family protein [Caulobacterales bacterium]|nr:crotonase/enoyl-CoA hydratase family protein [Caulobacterales bacterium]